MKFAHYTGNTFTVTDIRTPRTPDGFCIIGAVDGETYVTYFTKKPTTREVCNALIDLHIRAKKLLDTK